MFIRRHDWNNRSPWDLASSSCRCCGRAWTPGGDLDDCGTPQHGPPVLSDGKYYWPGSLYDVVVAGPGVPHTMPGWST